MCLAVPSKIISKADQMAVVDVYGARKEISLVLVQDDVEVGDYVLVHAGFAIQKMDEASAHETLQLLKELEEIMDAEDKARKAAE